MYVYFIAVFNVSNAVLTKFNQTLTHVEKWARFENGRPKFGSLLLWNMGAHILPFSDGLWRLRDLSANIFGTNKDLDKRKKQTLTAKYSLCELRQLRELQPTNGWVSECIFTCCLKKSLPTFFIYTKITERNWATFCHVENGREKIVFFPKMWSLNAYCRPFYHKI